MYYYCYTIKLRWLVLTICLLLILSINSLAQENKIYLPILFSDGSGSSPPPDIIEPLPSPPNVAPNDYADLIEQNVAAGLWTEEEGIVQILKLLVNEVDPADIPGFDEVIFGAANHVEEMAQAYLADNPNSAVAIEIERRLDDMLPPLPNIQRYSQPIPTSNSVPDANTISAQEVGIAQQDCAVLWKEGYEGNPVAGPCLFYTQRIVQGRTLRVYHPVDWHNDSQLQPYFAAAIDALEDSTNVYSTYGDMPDATLIFTPLFDRDSLTSYAGAGVHLTSDRDYYNVCPIVIYTPALAFPLDQFKQIIAHEMFHCYQRLNMIGPGDRDWYIEGSANYFSNVVYPDANMEYIFLENFHIASARQPIYFMSYENFIFFQYLANVTNDNDFTLLGLLEFLPSQVSVKLQHQILINSIPNMADVFHQFGEDYFDGQILDTSGAKIPSANLPLYFTDEVVNKEPTVFDKKGDSAQFPAHVFRLTRHSLQYAQKKRFTQEYQINAPTKQSAKPLRAGAINPALGWGDLPKEIDTGCDDDSRYFLLLTNSDVDKQHPTVSFETNVTKAEERQKCTCYFEADLSGAVKRSFSGPAGYNVNSSNTLLVMALYEQWFSQMAVDNYATGLTGTLPAKGFFLLDNASGVHVGMSQPSDGVIMTIDESQSDFIRGRIHGTLTDLSVTGSAGTVILFVEFRAVNNSSHLANQCNLEWE